MKKKHILISTVATGALLAGTLFNILPVNAKPLFDVDPLMLATRTVWDKNIRTVGDATRWVLAPSGFKLLTRFPAPKESAALMAKPIPPSMKMHRTMPIIDALQLLVGEKNTVIVDRQHHLISFKEGDKE